MRQLQTEPVFRAPFVVGLRARRRPPRAGAFCGPASCWSSFSCLCFLAPPASRQCHFPAPVGPGPVQEPLVSRNGGPARRIVKGIPAPTPTMKRVRSHGRPVCPTVFYATAPSTPSGVSPSKLTSTSHRLRRAARRRSDWPGYVHVYNIVKKSSKPSTCSKPWPSASRRHHRRSTCSSDGASAESAPVGGIIDYAEVGIGRGPRGPAAAVQRADGAGVSATPTPVVPTALGTVICGGYAQAGGVAGVTLWAASARRPAFGQPAHGDGNCAAATGRPRRRADRI